MTDTLDHDVYLELDPIRISQTAEALQARIEERFPGSGLGNVGRELVVTSRNSRQRIREIARPYWPVRVISMGVILGSITLLGYTLLGGVSWGLVAAKPPYSAFISVLEPTLGAVFFITAFYVFVGTRESRWRQKQILRAINELRSLAHKIDMHQLTKDPERLLVEGPDTDSSPSRTMTAFEMGRYLDYCSELLSVTTKVSALYAQAFPEAVVVNAVDQIELLATGLSRKIWQKLTMLSP